MTRSKTHSGYYVTALYDSGTANERRMYLLGPFIGKRAWIAAQRMVEPVRRSCNIQYAAFGTSKLTYEIGKPLPPGRLDLNVAVDDDWIAHVIGDTHRPANP